jgi:3',5'-cyclic AMP phosphodiesterase CpdA
VRKVLALGDLQYEVGAYSEFVNAYTPSWGSFKDKTVPVPGNHEYGTSGATGYYDFWGTQGRRDLHGFQDFTVDSWRVFGLNTNCDKIDCAAEVARIDTALTATPTRCVLVYGHHPIYSSGSHGNTAWMAQFRTIFNKHGVDLYLAGHDHDYERFGRVGIDSFRQFVVGTGGKSMYAFSTVQTGSQTRISQHGVGFFTLNSGWYGWDFQDIYGSILDTGAGSCV